MIKSIKITPEDVKSSPLVTELTFLSDTHAHCVASTFYTGIVFMTTPSCRFGPLLEFISIIQINRRKCGKPLAKVWSMWLKWRAGGARRRKTLRAEICDFQCCGLRSRCLKELNFRRTLRNSIEFFGKVFFLLTCVFPQCVRFKTFIIPLCRLQSIVLKCTREYFSTEGQITYTRVSRWT